MCNRADSAGGPNACDTNQGPCACGAWHGSHHPSVVLREHMALQDVGEWDAGTLGASQLPPTPPTKFSPTCEVGLTLSDGWMQVILETSQSRDVSMLDAAIVVLGDVIDELIALSVEQARRIAAQDQQLAMNDLVIHTLMRERDAALEQLAAAQARVEELERQQVPLATFVYAMKRALDSGDLNIHGKCVLAPSMIEALEQASESLLWPIPAYVAALVAEAARETEQATGVSVEQAAKHFVRPDLTAELSAARETNAKVLADSEARKAKFESRYAAIYAKMDRDAAAFKQNMIRAVCVSLTVAAAVMVGMYFYLSL